MIRLLGLWAVLAAAAVALRESEHFVFVSAGALAIAVAAVPLFKPTKPRDKLGLRVVCVSDTHGHHRELRVPPGDLLIHAGDWTHFGKKSDAIDFNQWLGELPHRHKVVVNGNHESNAMWAKSTPNLITNATFLKNGATVLTDSSAGRNLRVKIHGTDFFWPSADGSNPYFDYIQPDVDILVAHGPAKGCVDSGTGCTALLKCVKRVKPALV
eukprot:Sspe_Gene.7975::Locus_2704_Transcript_1_1_Confidence_1.000_Length_739::g.7975::m.7975